MNVAMGFSVALESLARRAARRAGGAAASARLAVTSGAFRRWCEESPTSTRTPAARRAPKTGRRRLRGTAPRPERRAIAVTMFDPDAPTGHGFWHWVMFDIPATAHRLAPGMGEMRAAPADAVLGHVDFGISAYGGPCPPPGDTPHHYIVTVRALDVATVHGANAGTTGPELVALLAGHELAQGTIVGRFGR